MDRSKRSAATRGILAVDLRFLVATLVLVVPLQAQAVPKRVLEEPAPVLVPTHFASAMTRARLSWLIRGPKPLAIALDDAEPQPTGIPFYWEAEDGSTVRRMEGGSFRVEIWSSSTNWTQFLFCAPASWPTFMCNDGATHEMSAPDLSTIDFAGRTYTRVLPPSDLVLDDELPPEE